jgi:hypothetical protein
VCYPVKQEKSVKGADSNLGAKTTLCNKFIASQLGVLDSARRIVKCLKLARDGRFLHTSVDFCIQIVQEWRLFEKSVTPYQASGILGNFGGEPRSKL